MPEEEPKEPTWEEIQEAQIGMSDEELEQSEERLKEKYAKRAEDAEEAETRARRRIGDFTNPSKNQIEDSDTLDDFESQAESVEEVDKATMLELFSKPGDLYHLVKGVPSRMWSREYSGWIELLAEGKPLTYSPSPDYDFKSEKAMSVYVAGVSPSNKETAGRGRNTNWSIFKIEDNRSFAVSFSDSLKEKIASPDIPDDQLEEIFETLKELHARKPKYFDGSEGIRWEGRYPQGQGMPEKPIMDPWITPRDEAERLYKQYDAKLREWEINIAQDEAIKKDKNIEERKTYNKEYKEKFSKFKSKIDNPFVDQISTSQIIGLVSFMRFIKNGQLDKAKDAEEIMYWGGFFDRYDFGIRLINVVSDGKGGYKVKPIVLEKKDIKAIVTHAGRGKYNVCKF